MDIQQIESKLWAAADKLHGNTAELNKQFARSHELETKIKANLEKIDVR